MADKEKEVTEQTEEKHEKCCKHTHEEKKCSEKNEKCKCDKKKNELEELKKQNEELLGQVALLKNEYAKAYADTENTRKRLNKEFEQ